LNQFLERAGRWFLDSGIQEANGGVARYYRSDAGGNLPVSTEITGYAVSALAFLHQRTGNAEYLDAANRAGHFLTRQAWDAHAHTFPFEIGSDKAYFFDIGIIVRGLLRLWRTTGEPELLERAREGALSLAFDFIGEGEFAPIIALPEKQPLPYEKRWSREPGCFQLKAAMAWHGIAQACGEEHAARMFEMALTQALQTHATFLPGAAIQEAVMDRLHAYSYFLEALLAMPGREDVRRALAQGVAQVGSYLREIAPVFERSDVNAQLLRVRLIAHHLGALELDYAAAAEEAARIAAFQIESVDKRLDGGFWFGCKGAAMLPFANPVSTAFCVQALALWQDHQQGRWNFTLEELI
jgi:hypothetical protein